jgi:hypothetical protein
VLTEEDFISEAHRIVIEGGTSGVVLRLLGAVGIRVHASEYVELWNRLRRLGDVELQFTDLDFVGYSKQRPQIRQLMERLGYQIDLRIMTYFGENRHVYLHPERSFHVDVFFDKLQFSHRIDFGDDPSTGRLRYDTVTIPLGDLLLEKLQIHDISEKDIKDLIVLLRAHSIGTNEEKDTINALRVATVLSNDWGFWSDATTNLANLARLSEKYLQSGVIDSEDFRDLKGKIETLHGYIARQEKTKAWLKRSEKGEKKIWWEEVDAVKR